ncbi:hypothetical protein H2201_001625 [Coniosporium apollinis]|uniref:tRNA-splicing endonuclease subunit Sen15 domain-containing protein n=2 Tax=Coniosporium TaxID=2810619 RepID=A0ABQ9P4G9_9PEZI|nr:hypothetical protein H2199_007513 [Cladosporium sp. JES 115]KAJ9668196.1 hypothetical protein H2201_001625 [Coniosporium apollinis]
MAAATASPPPSALTKLISAHTPTDSTHPAHLHHLALQIQHNLQHQHLWTALTIHTHSPLAPYSPLPRPLISGLPPQRLYVHPDEQVELLAREARRRREGKKGEGGKGEEKVDREKPPPEREWVLPTHVREKWSLRRFGEVFEGIGVVPPEPTESGMDEERGATSGRGERQEQKADGEVNADVDTTGAVRPEGTEREGEKPESAANKWRTLKRVVLATLDDDSTVVYYVVHDGIVKPRQN